MVILMREIPLHSTRNSTHILLKSSSYIDIDANIYYESTEFRN